MRQTFQVPSGPVAFFAAFVFAASGAARGQETKWNQFRGPGGAGVVQSAQIPVHFGPDQNLLWKTALPPGHSSPVIWGGRIFITAYEGDDKLETIAIDRADGHIFWRQAVQSQRKPNLHELNDAASPTPVADERHVYAYFGAYGLICYDHAGNKVWERKLDPPRSKYGVATSPIPYKNTIVLVLDGDGGTSRLLAVDRDTGKTVWEQPRPLFRAGWGTPMIFHHDAVDELVVLGSRRLTSYDPTNGNEIWWAGGFSRETVGMPVAGGGLLFAGAAALGGRGDDDIDAARTWEMTLEQFDKNHDGKIEKEEITDDFAFIQRPELPKDNPGYAMPVRGREALLRIFDHNHDGVITEDEWMQTMASFAAMSRPTLQAIRPGAKEDARKTHLAWEIHRGVPEVPCPLYCRSRLYLLRDGGILTCLNPSSGAVIFQGRIGALGQYIASPIAAGDKIVVASTTGVVSVIQIDDHLNVLASNDLAQPIFATPAIADDTLYVRTEEAIYAVGEKVASVKSN
ncbi:MAG TPA: PQQ-binding-like beta-propeller repeat protein [Tepidisphaeraceae bacterium]|nr:PQQ-binding-like beta-propeller repeat protein [Tepidisphaeraceae bacterium]